jgi:hypothetical protein
VVLVITGRHKNSEMGIYYVIKRKNKVISTLLMAGLGLSVPAIADQAEIEMLKKRIQSLEEGVAQQSPAVSIAQQVSFYGVVEFEASYSSDDETGSDFVVATVDLGLEADLTEGVKANVSVLYEEDDTDLEIDIATISFESLAGTNSALILGQDYLPFGSFETYMVNDTLCSATIAMAG